MIASVKCWGRGSSLNTQKVLWALAELDMDCELVLASNLLGPDSPFETDPNKYGVVDTPEYLARAPTGLIPSVEIGLSSGEQLVLFESNAIVRYLALKSAESAAVLHDGTDEGFARASVWMDVALASGAGERLLKPVGYPLHSNTLRLPPAERDETIAMEARDAFVTEALTLLEPLLGRSDYLAGGAFSMGDIPIACVVNRFFFCLSAASSYGWDFREAEVRTKLPNIIAWYTRLTQRPAFLVGCVEPEAEHFGIDMTTVVEHWTGAAPRQSAHTPKL